MDAWDSFWKLVRMLVVMAVIVVVATHLTSASLSHAEYGVAGAVHTLDALLQRVAHTIPLPTGF